MDLARMVFLSPDSKSGDPIRATFVLLLWNICKNIGVCLAATDKWWGRQRALKRVTGKQSSARGSPKPSIKGDNCGSPRPQ